MILIRKHAGLVPVLASAVLLSGCLADDDNNSSNSASDAEQTSNKTFAVTVTNATAGQPLSPLAVVAHGAGYHTLVTGTAASIELEQLAEGGDNSALLAAANSNPAVYSSQSGEGVVVPGGTATLTITLDGISVDSMGAMDESILLSITSMLVNTNDGVIAASALDVTQLAVGSSLQVTANSYDAGTEANSESSTTIPGPAAGGEGFNASRDDRQDQVTLHAGVVTQDDGLASSALTHVHRWDNPVALITVTRTE